MTGSKDFIEAARTIQNYANSLGVGRKSSKATPEPASLDLVNLYDVLVTSSPLREASRKLYVDGHYARAVEDALQVPQQHCESKGSLNP